MSNRDAPMGFRAVGHVGGGEIRARQYTIDETAPQIYQGDVVELNIQSGCVDLAAASVTARVLGVAAETHTSGSDTIMVYDDINIIYEVQGYTGVTFAAGHVGETADIVATAGDSTLKQSRMELNEPELDINGAFLILGKTNSPDNAWGEHVKLLAIVNPSRSFTHEIATS